MPATQKRHGSSTAFVIPMRSPARICGSRQARRAWPDHDRPGGKVETVVVEPDTERLRELARSGAELGVAPHAPARAHLGEPRDWLQRADQDGGPDSGRLTDGVQ